MVKRRMSKVLLQRPSKGKEGQHGKARWRAEARSCQKNLSLKSWSCCAKGSSLELFVGWLQSGEMTVISND